ncbi:MAG: hypothetical protein J0I07_25250, partial [Myxococcales bacterium]|nr:hypothetical protein [Myxococcales bacterium]
ENAFMSKVEGEPLSPLGKHYLAGLLDHARAATVFTTPTINGYKRYRSYSLAPDRAIWGRDNRGVMLRVLGGPNDPATLNAMVAHNRALYDQVVRVGGTRYSIGSIPFSRHDWQQHFRPRWGLLVSSKRRFDPDNVLTPGQAIFT